MEISFKNDEIYLLKSLGSFWNQIFSERETLKGYCRGLSEELIQEYLVFIETLNSFSIKNIPAFNKTRWYPLSIKKSEFNKVPLFFEANDAVFGAQPASSFYNGKVFEFGVSKSPSDDVYVVKIDSNINSINLITDQIVNPSHFFIKNLNFVKKNDELFFNVNIFDLNATKNNVIDNQGKIATYVDANGVTQVDQEVVFWIYNVDIDLDNISEHFGYIYDFKIADKEKYRDIIEKLMSLSVTGPVVDKFKRLVAAFSGFSLVKSDGEIIESILTADEAKYVVTDKEVYRFNVLDNFAKGLKIGQVLTKGQCLVDVFEYYDAIENPSWWKGIFSEDKKIGFSQHVFVGNYQKQLFLSNSLDLITLSKDDVLYFPVIGADVDVLEFQKWINLPDNKTEIKSKLGLVISTNPTLNKQVYPIIPIDFVFTNFFKNNLSFIVYRLRSNDDFLTFFNYFSVIRKYLPAHIYILIDIQFNIDFDLFNTLNGSYNNNGTILNSDGSNSVGAITASNLQMTNLTVDMFKMAITPGRGGSNLPLYFAANMDPFYLGGNVVPKIKDGKIFTYIPNGATTRDIPSIQLIDFS